MCAESDFPFGPDALVFKIKEKMLAILAEWNGREYVSVKVTPEDGLVQNLCERSYDLVVAKLTKAQRISFGYQ